MRVLTYLAASLINDWCAAWTHFDDLFQSPLAYVKYSQAADTVEPIFEESGSLQSDRGRGSAMSRGVLQVETQVRRSGRHGFRDATLMPGEHCGQAHQIDGQHGCADEQLEARAP